MSRIGRPRKPRVTPEDDAYEMTLGDLEARCASRLWKGKANEVASQRRLNQFVHLLGRDMPLARIRKHHLEDLQDVLLALPNGRKGTYSPATVNRIMMAGSKALGWAVDNEYLVGKPKFPLLDEDNEKNAWIREQDVPRFAEFVMEHQGWRYAVSLMTLLVTGMRVSELTTLRASQVEREYDGLWYLRLKAKNTKTRQARSVPIPAALARPLKDMLEDPRGVPTYRQLWRTCLSATSALNLPEKVTPHTLRHSAATLMTRKGVPTATVAKLLGHANIKTTQRYDHWVPAHNPLGIYAGEDEVGYKSTARSVTEIHPVPIDMPKTYPKVEPDPHQQAVKWGNMRGTGGLGGNRTPVQGFAVKPENRPLARKLLKSRDKQED